MKSKVVIFGGVLFVSLCPVAVKAQDGPNLGAKNMRALAMIGSAYHRFEQSSGYRGHLVLTKVAFSPDTGTVTKTLDWKSSWVNRGDGEFSKRSTTGTFTENKAGVTTTESFSGVDDGNLTKRLYTTRQVWTEKAAISEYDVALNFARAPYQIAVLLVAQGVQFEIANATQNGQELRIVKAGTALEVALDSKTLSIKSWKADKTGESTNCVWLSQELNPTFKSDEWAFNVPPTAKQVAPETVNLKLEF